MVVANFNWRLAYKNIRWRSWTVKAATCRLPKQVRGGGVARYAERLGERRRHLNLCMLETPPPLMCNCQPMWVSWTPVALC